MPRLIIEVDEHESRLLREQAAQRRCPPEELARDILSRWLRRTHKTLQAHPVRLLGENGASSLRGSLERVMDTLDIIQRVFPSEAPPPTREEVDAYLQTERDSWDKQVEE
jgi:hypothetical protein